MFNLKKFTSKKKSLIVTFSSTTIDSFKSIKLI